MTAGFRAAESSDPSVQAAGASGFEPFAQDYLLAQRAAQADGRAQKQVALRLVARIRRAAHALMGGAAEADDAAHHALIEVLRSLGGYAGANSLEAWSDRLSARSIVRFARAVRARAGLAASGAESKADAARVEGGAPSPSPRPERLARTVEEFLRQLPSAPREALLLREVFGFDVIQTAQLLRLSPGALREQLARARQSLIERASKESRAEPTAALGLPDNVSRWFALRDGEARIDSQLADIPGSSGVERAQDQQRLLEDEQDVRRMQRELRALAQLLETGRLHRPGARDRKLVDGALSAVRVSSVTPSRAPAQPLTERRESADGGWVQAVSLTLCAGLVVGAFIALAFYRPHPPAPVQAAQGPASRDVVRPTVEALSSAHSVDPRGRLKREDTPLSEGAIMREGDVISAATRPGCFVLSAPVDVCLSPGSEARIARLGGTDRSVELLAGRSVASVERAPGPNAQSVPFAIVVGELRAEVNDADFGVEIADDLVIVRALRGTLVLALGDDARLLAGAQSAIYRRSKGTLEVAPQLIEKARRDWDLLAARVGTSGAARALLRQPRGSGAPTTARDARANAPLALSPDEASAVAELVALEPQAVADELAPIESTPEALLDEAKQLSRERLWAEAEQLYELIATRFPQHPLAREAWVLQGELLAERLQRPADALAVFERYLEAGGGPLAIRARYGRIVALRKLDRPEQEREAVNEFLSLHRSTPQARVLLSAAEVPDVSPDLAP